MKKKLFIFFLIIFSINIFAESNFENFYAKDNPLLNVMGQFTYSVSAPTASKIAMKYKKTGYDYFSAESLNTLGFRLYEQKAYADAAELFKRAIQINPSSVFPHYNLACMLSLLTKQGQLLNIEQIIYHLQYAALLDPKYATKPNTDSDLDPVRKNDSFQSFLNILNNGRISFTGSNVSLKAGTANFVITKLEEYSSGPRSSSPVFTIAPDKSAAAFLAKGKNGPGIFVLLRTGLLISAPTTDAFTEDDMVYTNIIWQPESKGIVYNHNSSGLHYYDIKQDKYTEILHLPWENGQDYKNPEYMYFGAIESMNFISNNVLRFMGGSYFEYSFSGYEYEININGTGFRKVPGGKYIPGEDLRGSGE